MCGLVAMFSKEKNGFLFKDKTIMTQMLFANVFRGADSTGMFGVNKYGNLDMIKKACASPVFIGHNTTKNFIDDIFSDYCVVVGHNRKATMGTIVDDNAHPFIEDHICLVHNGTLTNHKNLSDKTIDSHAICHHIATDGYKSMLKNINGAYALIWYDAKEKKVYFCRNAERPLYLVETNDKIYIASEGKMLDWILDRNDVTKYQVQNVPTDKVFKFDLESRKLECESKPKKDTAHSKKKNQDGGSTSLVIVDNKTKPPFTKVPTVNTYKAGDEVTFYIDDFDIQEHTTHLMGITDDEFESEIICWLSNKDANVNRLDELVSAKSITGIITSTSWKNGKIKIWIKDPKPDPLYTTKSGIPVSKSTLDSYGGCCYSCGSTLTTKSDIENATITVNTDNQITSIMCQDCEGTMHYAYPYGGLC